MDRQNQKTEKKLVDNIADRSYIYDSRYVVRQAVNKLWHVHKTDPEKAKEIARLILK